MNTIKIGKIGSPYGVKGWFKVFSYTEKKNDILVYQPWFIEKYDNKFFKLNIENYKLYHSYFLVKIFDIQTREDAVFFTNFYILIDKIQLPKLSKDTYYWSNIIGFTVITENNKVLGQLISFIRTTMHDIMVVMYDDNKINSSVLSSSKECLIPFVLNNIVQYIDKIKRIIIVDWNDNF